MFISKDINKFNLSNEKYAQIKQNLINFQKKDNEFLIESINALNKNIDKWYLISRKKIDFLKYDSRKKLLDYFIRYHSISFELNNLTTEKDIISNLMWEIREIYGHINEVYYGSIYKEWFI